MPRVAVIFGSGEELLLLSDPIRSAIAREAQERSPT
jgi:hypothetical protein